MALDLEITINKLLAEAMSQINKSGYADSNAASNKQIHKIAIVFSTQERNIVGWQIALV
jgi:hypothetical protein